MISNISGHFLIAPGVIFEKPVISLLQSFGKNNNFKRIINSKKKERAHFKGTFLLIFIEN